ncbi:MAG: hypothetical protein KDG89_17930 [Geminicoccaceae bacterium]|nr:hypothetical protein [Geminicoccaceae bacterium]
MAAEYTADDHPYLANPAVRDLFDILRKEVLALDPCVTEEFFKTCIAYKVETNFANIVLQASRLKIILNVRFHKIADVKDICRDVTNVGHLGSGDIELNLATFEELPYAIGLVRQSFERQMGVGEND